jgi:S1-C subfamily serine protease
MDENLNPIEPSETSRWPAWTQTLLRHTRRIGPFIIIIVCVFAGIYLYGLLFPAPPLPSQNEIDENVRLVMASVTPPPPYSTMVYQVILPSLVFIQTERADAEEDERVGVGTGVVVNANGDILTSLHVVADASAIEITFADGTEATAQIISAEPENDIAVLRPSQPPELLVPAILGNSGAMRVGDEAFAVGNPMGLAASMSAGVISGFNRSIPIEDSEQRLEGLIQFDTAVNPGNSGGPLLNRQGQVVGIVTALANPSDQNFFIGIGFAVPIGTAVGAAGGPPY